MEVIHRKLVDQLRTFLLVGGMPESVKTWVEKSDYLACRNVQNDILEAFIDGFAKYKKMNFTFGFASNTSFGSITIWFLVCLFTSVY